MSATTVAKAAAADSTPLEHVNFAGHKSRVCYFYDGDIGAFYYGAGHPMKPHRLRMTHNLLLSYGIYKKMEIYRPHPASHQEMTQFHATEYVDFLRRVTPDNAKENLNQLQRFNMGQYTDCPIFDGLYEFCQLSAGGSIDGAMRLNHGLCDIAINWAGGLHHAKKSEASGFCYVNDIVLAILELLKYHARVLYIDIDIHHGDGVEEAFYTTDRVMTVSFHKFGDFFPGTGDLKDAGTAKGKNYSINFPLQDGIDDKSYQAVFQPVIQKVMEVYRPGAVVLQCGADSLTGDRLGCFNLTVKGHGECVKFVKSFGIPLLVLGGGGYNIRNVSRCWTYETAVLLDTSISNNIPFNDFFQYYGPDFRLHLHPQDVPNNNPKDDLEKTKISVLQNLSSLEHAPSVQMQAVPPDMYSLDDEIDEPDRDIRINPRDADKMVHRDNEFYADEKDQDKYLQSGGASARPRPNLFSNGSGSGSGSGSTSAAAASAATIKLSSAALTTAGVGDSKDFKSSLPGTAVPTGAPVAGSSSYSAPPQMFGKKPHTPTSASTLAGVTAVSATAGGGGGGGGGSVATSLSSAIPKQSTSAPMDTHQ